MSKLQSDVRNAESEILEYLYSQIQEGFTFNYIEPVVLASSNYLIRGTDYSASVFMATFDTTQNPKVYIGQYDSTITDNGTIDYFMKGELGRDYDSVRVIGGRGVYSSKPLQRFQVMGWHHQPEEYGWLVNQQALSCRVPCG